MNRDKEKENVKGKGGIMKLFSPISWRKKQYRKRDESCLSPGKSTDKNHASVQAPISDEDGKENSSFNANRTPSKFLKVWTDNFKRQWSIDRKKRKEQTEVNKTLKNDEATCKKEKPDDGDGRHDGNIQIQSENQKSESLEEVEEETLQSSDDETNQEVDEADDFNVYAMRRNSESKIRVEMQNHIDKGKEIWKFEGKLDAECKEVMDHFDEITECLETSVMLAEHERMTMTVSEEVIDQALLTCSINAEKEEKTDSALTLMTAEELVQDNQYKQGYRTGDEAKSTCEENLNRKRSIDSIKIKDEVAAGSVQVVPLLTAEPIQNQRLNENDQNMSVTIELRIPNEEDQPMHISTEDSSETEELADIRSEVALALRHFLKSLKENSELIKELVDNKKSIDLHGDSINTIDVAVRGPIQDVTSFAAEAVQNHRHNQNPENEQNMSATNELRNTNEENQPMNISNENSSETEEVADRRSVEPSALQRFLITWNEDSPPFEEQIVDSTRSIDLKKDKEIVTSNEDPSETDEVADLKENSELIQEQIVDNTEELVQNNRYNEIQNIEVLTTERRSAFDAEQDREQLPVLHKVSPNTKQVTESAQNVTSLNGKIIAKDINQNYDSIMLLLEFNEWTQTKIKITDPCRRFCWEYEEAVSKKSKDGRRATQCIEQEPEVNAPQEDTRSSPRNNVTSVKVEEETVPTDLDFTKICELESVTLPKAVCNMSQEELDEVQNRTVDTVEDYLIPGRITREENECQTASVTLPKAICNMSQEELDEIRNRTVDTVEAYLIPGRITREENEYQTEVALECQADISEVAMLSSEVTQEQEKRTIDYVLDLGSNAEDQDFLNKESARIQRAKVYFKNIDAFYKSKNAARENEQLDQFFENRARQYRCSVADFFSNTNM